MYQDKEKKYRRISWLASLGVQLVLLLLFYFLIAWKEPFPPVPSYGIELSFGLENVGSGTKPVTTPKPQEDVMTEQPEEESESIIEESAESEAVESDFIEDHEVSETNQAETVVTDLASPDVVESEPEKEKQPEEEKKKAEQTESSKKAEESKQTEVKQEALMPKAETGEENKSSGENAKEGKEGKEEGTIDGRALMGEQGTSKGASLQMAGWVWESKPDPKDDSSEEGKIVYKIMVDEDGEIRGLDLMSSTVSPSVERYYRQSIQRLTFSKTNGYKPAPTSSGTITFIIRSK